MEWHASENVMDPQRHSFEFFRRDLRHRVSFLVPDLQWQLEVSLRVGVDPSVGVPLSTSTLPVMSSRLLRNSLVAAGPVTRTTTGPVLDSATSSNVKNGQHARSATINSATSWSDPASPERRKA